MNDKPKRKTAAARAYETLRQAGGKLRILHAHELLRVARAIRPGIEEHECRLEIVEDRVWLDEKLAPSSYVRSSDFPCQIYRLIPLLVFFREEAAEHRTRNTHTDVRMVLTFERAERGTRICLDAETGLPWRSRTALHYRGQFCDDNRKRQLCAEDSEDYRRARAEVERIEREKNEGAFWVDDNNYREERVVEHLEFRRRAGEGKLWETVTQYCTRYHPAGSLLYTVADREAYRLNFLREQQEAIAA